MQHTGKLTRREMLRLGAGAAVATVVAGGTGCPTHKHRKPNILFLMADQFRADCIGAAGNSAIQTPNLDRIAREGVLFSNAYSCTPTCTPARAALLSGLGPWRNGLLGYADVPEKYPVEMPRALRDAGYYTLGIGKMHWHPQRNLHGFHRTLLDESGRVEDPGFCSDYRAWFASEAPDLHPDATGIGFNDYRSAKYALPERVHPTRWTGQTAVNFLQEYEGREPFFLKVSFTRPHSPYDPPERFWKMYDGVELPEAAVGDWAHGYAPRSGDSNNIWHGDMGKEQVRRSRQGYYGSVSFIDEQIGQVLQVLEKRRWMDDTLIVFTSDHGDMLGDHHLWRKGYAYESSARIPMLIRWPDRVLDDKRGQVRKEPVELRDVLPTFLQAANAPGAQGLDGRSMLPLIVGDADGWRPWIDLEHDVCYSPKNHWNALTDGQWKYIFHAEDGHEQLFNLAEDSGEERNLAGETAYAATLSKWRERLRDHLAERGAPFVVDGKLAPRPERLLYSPHYTGCSCHTRA